MLDLSNDPLASDAHTEHTVLDTASLNQLRSLDPTGGELFLRKVLETYLRSLEAQMELASVAFVAAQHDELSRAVHSLKSASASIGALQFSRLCERIEHAVRRQELGAIASNMAEFKQEAGRVRAAAERLLGPTAA